MSPRRRTQGTCLREPGTVHRATGEARDRLLGQGAALGGSPYLSPSTPRPLTSPPEATIDQPTRRPPPGISTTYRTPPFLIATDDQQETDRYWNAIVGNGGKESACGWCKDKWGVSLQIIPRVLTEALAAGGDEAKRALDAMMEMKKIDIAAIKAARLG
jgi:3-demethylubiquinone-9 3-methyltransferase